MKAVFALLSALALAPSPNGCDDPQTTTDEKQSAAQAASLEQAHASVGMPSISRFEEKRMLKDLYELRDKAIATHSYIVNEMKGCLVYLGPSVGYGLPYGTQFTSPTRVINAGYTSQASIPQPEPNGLYVPETAEGTWIMLKDPAGGDVRPVYIEPRVIVSPFRLAAQECAAEVTASPVKIAR